MSDNNIECYGELVSEVLTAISQVYWGRMYKYIKDNNIDYKDVNCFILNPESMAVYFSKTFIAIEYCGNPYVKDIVEKSERMIVVRDFTKEDLTSKQVIEKIIGFTFDGTSKISFPLHSDIYEDLMIPTNAGLDKLVDLKWNFAAQNSMVSFNSQGLDIVEGHFVRLINGMFFDAKDDDLKTRIIKWIDFIPCHYNEPTEGEVDEIGFSLEVYDRLWQADLFYQYPEPADFKYDKLPKINRFIELFGDSENSEPNITSFLAQRENHFILNMGFMGTGIHSQVKCDWQSEEKDEIIPDFFVVRANGYADIVEFKLPKVKGNTVVGRNNREQFSAEINSYIAQTRVYRSYFEDPNNRKWFEEKYGFKVYKPKRYLVVGRRNDFECDEWVEIKADYTDVEIVTYDDLIDTVVSQFYQ